MGVDRPVDRGAILGAISQLRPACEESLFAEIDGHSYIVFVDLRNWLRVNLELIESLGALLAQGIEHSYAAIVIARSSFEISVTTAWVLYPHSRSQWEARFASVLDDEIRQQTRTGFISIDEDNGPGYSLVEFLKEFVEPDAPPVEPLPNMRERLKAIDAERSYTLYGLTSQFTHGSRAAHQARYGWYEDKVKVDQVDEWKGALGIALSGFRRAVEEFTFCSSLYSLASQSLPEDDDERVSSFRHTMEQRSALVLSLVDECERRLESGHRAV